MKRLVKADREKRPRDIAILVIGSNLLHPF